MSNRLSSAYWISGSDLFPEYALHFQKEFEIGEVVPRTKLYICGLGFYYAKINGTRVGEDLLQPAISKYDTTVYYNVYDITVYLKPGKNILEVQVGNGFYNEIVDNVWGFQNAVWRAAPKLLAAIWADDSLLIKTDTSWSYKKSRIQYNSLRSGETYNAAAEESDWIRASLVTPPCGLLKKQTIPPVRVERRIKPVREYAMIIEGKIYDFGVNLTGNVELKVRGKRGTKIHIQYFERLRDDISPDLEYYHHGVNYNRFQKDEYILSGCGEEIWHSEFSYNGFRYIKVWYEGTCEEISFEARFFHTAIGSSGSIETDDPLITKIQNAVRLSTLCNLVHIPTDCPHREKNGWTGDAHIASEQALYNFDIASAYGKWLDDLVDCQMPSGQIPCVAPTSSYGYEWGSGVSYDVALFLMPWELYLHSGELKWLRRYYDAMERYFDYYPCTIEDGLCKVGLGDWLPVPTATPVPEYAFLTAYAYYIAVLFSKISGLLDKPHNQKRAVAFAETLKTAFHREFGALQTDNQVFYAMQLCFGLTDQKEFVLNRLLEIIKRDRYHIMGGFFSSKLVLCALTENGAVGAAYRIVSQTDYPSWGYLVDQCGGTIGEDWYGGGSRNHHALSEVSAWYYKALGGINIDPENPGFRNILLRPYIPANIRNFSARHKTPYGIVSVSWDKDFVIVEIPNGTTAQFVYHNVVKTLCTGRYQFERKYNEDINGGY